VRFWRRNPGGVTLAELMSTPFVIEVAVGLPGKGVGSLPLNLRGDGFARPVDSSSPILADAATAGLFKLTACTPGHAN